jgi:hypothetical protein
MAERLRGVSPQPPAHRPRWLASLLALLFTLGLAALLLHHGAAGAGDGRATLKPGEGHQPPAMQPQPVRRRDLYRRLEPIPPELAAAPRIRLGVHLENAYNLSIPDQTYMADGWYWLEWPEAVQQRIEAEKIDPDQLVEVVNNIVGYDFSVKADNSEPQLRPDGSRYQLFRFSGHFYIDDLNMRRSPFNQLSLPLLFETRPQSFAVDGEDPVLLVPKANQEGLVGAYASINGYQEVGVNIQPLIHTYPTDFDDGATHAFPMTELRVYYRIPRFTAFLQWLLPLLIVMAVVFLAPSLEASLGELRLAIPSTALLTLVVMQQTYQAELPPLPYLTFLDIIYAYSYLIAIAQFVLFVWGINVLAAAEAAVSNETADQAAPAAEWMLRRRIDLADRRFQQISLAGLGAALILAYLF